MQLSNSGGKAFACPLDPRRDRWSSAPRANHDVNPNSAARPQTETTETALPPLPSREERFSRSSRSPDAALAATAPPPSVGLIYVDGFPVSNCFCKRVAIRGAAGPSLGIIGVSRRPQRRARRTTAMVLAEKRQPRVARLRPRRY